MNLAIPSLAVTVLALLPVTVLAAEAEVLHGAVLAVDQQAVLAAPPRAAGQDQESVSLLLQGQGGARARWRSAQRRRRGYLPRRKEPARQMLEPLPLEQPRLYR
mmetsp:Transcript_150875/g.289127  ORF Transcript_150875/g.289127 Transcript_150875/m.289127 type:complete len:104 (+) Transcript_150875:3011-3322(+)